MLMNVLVVMVMTDDVVDDAVDDDLHLLNQSSDNSNITSTSLLLHPLSPHLLDRFTIREAPLMISATPIWALPK